jgi:hypothetical protein
MPRSKSAKTSDSFNAANLELVILPNNRLGRFMTELRLQLSTAHMLLNLQTAIPHQEIESPARVTFSVQTAHGVKDFTILAIPGVLDDSLTIKMTGPQASRRASNEASSVPGFVSFIGEPPTYREPRRQRQERVLGSYSEVGSYGSARSTSAPKL